MDKLNEINSFLEQEMPSELKGLQNILKTLIGKLNKIKLKIDARLNILAEEKKYDKLAEYANLSKNLSLYIDELNMCLLEKQDSELRIEKTKKVNNISNLIHKIPNYEDYATNPDIEYPIEQDWKNRRPCRINFMGVSSDIKDWNEAFLFVFSQIYRNFPYQFEKIIFSKALNGRKPYFSRESNLRKSKKIPGTTIYAELNQSAETFKKLILSAMDILGISKDNLHIYIRRDYSLLHEK